MIIFSWFVFYIAHCWYIEMLLVALIGLGVFVKKRDMKLQGRCESDLGDLENGKGCIWILKFSKNKIYYIKLLCLKINILCFVSIKNELNEISNITKKFSNILNQAKEKSFKFKIKPFEITQLVKCKSHDSFWPKIVKSRKLTNVSLTLP